MTLIKISADKIVLRAIACLLGLLTILVTCSPNSEEMSDNTDSALFVTLNNDFTAQAEKGAIAYSANCAACHGFNLEGSTLGPILSGGNFLRRWSERTPELIFNDVRANMPPGGNESLTDADYLNIVAHIIAVNGAFGINEALTATTDFRLADKVSGISTARLPEESTPIGVTINGNVDDFVTFEPITDAMLEAPDPADWPMIRRDYGAHSYSPLDQIDVSNVNQLKLEWVWNMHEGDSEPSPLVYNGIVYLINPSNIIQALDGETGEIIWEHWAGPATREDMRNIAIYEDKIIQATTDARLVALDARTGEQVWETVVADNSKGFSNSSGPICLLYTSPSPRD